jgi:hypothetical protein
MTRRALNFPEINAAALRVATGDKGGDAVSLAAYLFGLRQSDAARRLAYALGISEGACRA